MLSVFPWLIIPYDSVTHLLGVNFLVSQTMPLTALTAFPYLFFRGHSLRTCTNSRRVGILLLITAVITVLVTLLNAIIEIIINSNPNLPLLGSVALRQLISLCLGLASFFMLQDSLLQIGLKSAMRWIIVGWKKGLNGSSPAFVARWSTGFISSRICWD